MIAVAAALQWEARALLSSLRDARRVPGSPRTWTGRWHDERVLVYRTGIGPEGAARATRSIVERWDPSVVISAGCVGGLREGLQTGDAVFPERILDPDQQTVLATDEPWRQRLRSAAGRAGIRSVGGTLLSVARPLLTVESKQENRRRFDATAVEMESSAIARVAFEHARPMVVARVVLDNATTNVPAVDGLIRPDGRVQPWRALQAITRQPGLVPMFVSLGRSMRQSEESLRRLFHALAWEP